MKALCPADPNSVQLRTACPEMNIEQARIFFHNFAQGVAAAHLRQHFGLA
jgi:hypothetical protein